MLAVYITGIVTTGVVSLVLSLELSKEIMKYKLQKKQIEADAKVRVEEINAQNKLELEKLLMDRNTKPVQAKNSFSRDEEYFEKPDRVKAR